MSELVKTIKINELPEKTSISNTDVFIIEDGAVTRKVTGETLLSYIENNTGGNDNYISSSSIGASGGVAPLDSNKKVPTANLNFGTATGTIYDGGKGQVLREDFDTHVADTSTHHSHSNKSVLDTITQDKIDAWDASTGSGDGVSGGNADTVDGYHANQLAKTGASFPMTVYGYTNDFGVDQTTVYNGTIDDLVNVMPAQSILHTIIYKPHFPNIGIPSGASEFLELYILKIENLQVDIRLTDNFYKHEYHNMRYNSATCLGWNENYLPLDGSLPMSGILTVPEWIDVNSVNDSTKKARVGYDGVNNRAYLISYDSANSNWRGVYADLNTDASNGLKYLNAPNGVETLYDIHHDGNSAKVVVSETDPGEGATTSYSNGTVICVYE